MHSESDPTRVVFEAPPTWVGPDVNNGSDSKTVIAFPGSPNWSDVRVRLDAPTVFRDVPLSRRGDSAQPLPIGEVFVNKYENLKTISRGGSSFVYLCQNRSNGHLLAVKEAFAPGSTRHYHDEQGIVSPEPRRKFMPTTAYSIEGKLQQYAEELLLREASVLAGLKFDGCARIREIFKHEDSLMFAMEYVQGESLAAFRKRKAKPSASTIETILKSLMLCVERVHEQGVVHGDIKPSNIVLRAPDDVVLIDWGSAFWFDDHESAPTSFTPGYSAPERHQDGNDLTPRCEIYSFAMTALCLITGDTPLALGSNRPIEEYLRMAAERYPTLGAWHEPLRSSSRLNPDERIGSFSDLRDMVGIDAPENGDDAGVVETDGAAIFVSYSKRDADRVEPYVQAMQKRGIGVWIDRGGIEPGASSWAKEILKGMRGCRKVILFGSDSSMNSPNVLDEIYLARDQEKPVVLARLDQAEIPDELRMFLVRSQHIEMAEMEPRTFADRVASLL